MATRRSTFAKRDRERAKQAKAAAKRERRLDRSTDDDAAPRAPSGGEDNADDLLRAIEELHQSFDAQTISFDDFEARKIELFERLVALDQ